MRSMIRTFVMLTLVSAVVLAQVSGDYRSVGSGVWATVGTWEKFDGTSWAAAAVKPGSTNNVTIQSGHTVTLSGTESCLNPTIESGAVLNGDAGASIGSPRTFRVYGTTVTVNGTLGDAAGGTINLEPNVASTTCTITGSGVVNISRIRPNQTGITIVLDIDTKVNYAGSGGTGGTGVQGNKANTIYTVNAGKTLSFGTSSSFSTGTGTSASANNTTVNVYGTIDLLSNNGYFALKTTAGAAVLNIYSGGLLKTGGNCSLTNGTDGGTATLSVDGSLTCGATLDLGVAVVSGTTGTVQNTATLTAPASQNVGGLGAVLTSAATLGSTIVKRGFAAQTGGGHSGIKRWYDITPTTNSGLNATLVFNYAESELNGIDEANLTAFRSTDNGTTWSPVSGTLDATGNTFTVTGIDAFSRWTLGDVTNPLPVELATFTASATRKGIELRWSTATEVNNKGFEVEKQQNGSWSTLGFVAGAGSSNERHDYSYTDQNAKGAAAYRLKQVDRDGAFHYSAVVNAQMDLTAADFGLSQNYPNPFNPSTSFTFAVRATGTVTVKVYDILGKEVATLFNGIAEANHRYTLRFDAARLPSGIYFSTLRSAGNTEMKRMMLLK